MKLPPMLYGVLRPKFIIKKYYSSIKDMFNLENKKILDFGCGIGSYAFLFDPSDYLGVDVDEGRIAYGKKLAPAHSFLALKNCRIPLQDRSFDIIWVSAMLHHISDELCLQYIREFSRILKPGGRIVVIEPYLSPHTSLRNLFMKLADDGDYIRTEEGYLKLFDGAFKITLHRKFKKVLYNELLFSAEKL